MNIPNGALYRDDVGAAGVPGLSVAGLPSQQITQLPRFFVDVVRLINPPAGQPEYVDVEMVEIIQVGDARAAPVRKVTRDWLDANPHFHAAHDAWKRGQQVAATGTPLEDWTGVGRAQAMAAKAVNVHTVEQLAELNDHGLAALGMGARELQAKARLYLQRRLDERAAEQAVADNLRLEGELARRDDAIAALSRELEALKAAQQATAKPSSGPSTGPVKASRTAA